MPDLPLEVWFAIPFLLAVPFVWSSERKKKRKRAAFIANATITDGVVSRENIVERHSISSTPSEEHKVRIAVIKFRAANKIEYEFNEETEDVGDVGSPVKVAYDPALPSSAVVVGEPRYQAGCAPILLIIAIILIILGYTT